MPPLDQLQLSRRERQIMDVLFEREECSASEVMTLIPDAPGYSAVRALIARLCDKGLVSYRTEGNKHIYSAKLEEKKAQDSAAKRLLKTFFRGSKVNAVNALLDIAGDDISAREIAELERTIKRLKKLKQEN